MKELSKLSAVKNYLHILALPGISQLERMENSEKIKNLDIVIDDSCLYICNICRKSVCNGNIPKYPLAKGFWIGHVLDELSSLRYVEKMLVAKVRQSCCCIRIASGLQKIKANAIAFQSPIVKLYDVLPPPKKDMEEVLAIMFTGPCKPSAEDLK